MSSNFGFDKVIPPVERSVVKKMDLSDLPAGLPDIPPEKERRANKRAEELGFASREPTKRVGEERILRHRKKAPAKLSLYIQGPAAIINKFIAYADKIGADSYWQAIDKLMTAEETSRAGD